MASRSFLVRSLLLLSPLFLFFPLPPLRFAFYLLLLVYLSGRIYSGLIRRNITSHRFCPATNLFYGETGYVDIFVENHSRLPAPFLLLEDKPDFFLNYFGRQLFLLSLKGREKRRIRYFLKGNRRGQFTLRDWQLSSSDLFGHSAWTSTFSDHRIITVFPRIFRLNYFPISFRQPFGEIKNRLPIFEETSRPRGVRPYQPGDERRHINWKLSARSGDLMVNQYTPAVSQRTLVLLDLDLEDYRFRFREFYSELGLEVAASCLNWLYERKQQIGLCTCGILKELSVEQGEIRETSSLQQVTVPAAAGSRHFTSLLDTLARIHPQDAQRFNALFEGLDMISIGGTALLVLVPDISDELAARLLNMAEMGFEIAVMVFGPTPKADYSITSFGIRVLYAQREEGMLQLEPLNA